jgi:predicted CxxxxCH...CXXCH cytochrome family protein
MRVIAILVLLGVVLGCSKSNDKAPAINLITGKHPAGWAEGNTGGLHPAAYIAGPSACLECHGKNMDGGISGVSCFSSSLNGITCHPDGPSGHPEGWSAPVKHGSSAKAELLGRDGFSHCAACHGADFAGGVVNVSCLNSAGCHGVGVLAPHSPKPWRSTLGGRTHTSTDAGNASACALCHTAGANSARQPSVTPPAGTAVGCYTNTLCHGVEGHVQNNWALPSIHGAAALSLANGDKGFKSCTFCHGSGYDGGLAEQSCLNATGCHNAGAPHPPKPWRSATGLSHTRCDATNAGQCALCHAGGSNSSRQPDPNAPKGLSGCFDNTLCHGIIGHASGWKDPAAHGAEAKKAPTASTGFSSCQICHGAAFVNGAAITCFKGIGCHGFGVNAPHSPKPWFSRSGGATHTTTDPANVGTCAICHTAGANSTIKPPFPAINTLANCFNNTLCHFHQIPYAPSATIPPTLHGGEAKKDLSICQACHGSKGSTVFDGVTLADGTKTIACSSCHTKARAHPTDWQGDGTYSHRSAGNKSVACALCHDVMKGASAPLSTAPSCYSATFTNSLGQARTCHASGPGSAPHTVPYNNHNATARSNFTYCLGCHQIAANSTKPPGCTNCHLQSPQANPNNCVSCHFKPPNGSAYPNIGSSHASHNALNVSDLCAECHSGLGLGTVDHLNRARLRTSTPQANPVAFGTLAKTGGLSPSYSASGTCLNTYCHGTTLVGGSNKSPLWGQAGYLQGCGTCHGFPPANAAHTNVTSATLCSGCHSHVNSTNNGFTASGLIRHINGTLEAQALHDVPYFIHNAAAAPSCLKASGGCHNIGNGTILYPLVKDAATGAPDCMSCHTLADPLIAGNGLGNCRSCHGTGGTTTLAAPTGLTWPNIRGSGNARHPSHHGSACGDCHPGVDSTGRSLTTAAGAGSGVNHGPNKNKLLGTAQTNSTQTVTGIAPNAARGTGSTCSHSSIPRTSCHGGPGTQSFTAP